MCGGWRVVYVDAELDDWQAIERVSLATGMDPGEWLDAHPEFYWRSLVRPTALAHLAIDVANLFRDSDKPGLVVLDSLQRIAQQIQSSKRKVSFFAMVP